MRPESVMRLIHDRALKAREREADLIRCTRREERAEHPVRATYRARTNGYVNGIDLRHMKRALEDAPGAEIRLHVTLGDFVAVGDTLVTVRDGDVETADALADEIRDAVLIAKRRDLDHDATTGVDQLANIAWTNGSSSRQNPEVAREALHALKDIASRWILEDPATADGAGDEPLPIVYPDNDLDRILGVMYSLLVVAHESQQHALAARVIDVYADLAERAEGDVRERLERDFGTAQELVEGTPASPLLTAARANAGTAFRVG
jgi:uncharacterized membrane protein